VNPVWHVDSGAGKSITGNRSLFSQLVMSKQLPSVKFGDGVIKQAKGSGSIVLCSELLIAPITLDNVLFIPNCPVNLLSVHAIARSLDCRVSFTSVECTAMKGHKVLWSFPASDNGTYHFTAQNCPHDSIPVFSTTQVLRSAGVPLSARAAQLWHERFGHPGNDSLRRLVAEGMVDGLPLTVAQVGKLHRIPCDACCKGKAVRQSFPQSTREVHAPLQLVHLDIMGPFSTKGLRGEYYILVLVDQYSGYAAVVPIARKSMAPTVIQTILIQWQTQLTGMQFKCLRSDRAKEFLGAKFEEWLSDLGARHELSVAYTPQQNGVAERYNGVVAGIARTLLIQSKLAKNFWPYAFLCAAYLRNRLPTSGGATPFELFFGVKPDVSLLRVFGSTCYVTLVNGKKRSKLGPRSEEGRFLGYSDVSKGYNVWVPAMRQVVVSRDCVFFEEYDHPPAPGHMVYDGGPLIGGADTAVNSDPDLDEDDALQVSPPLVVVDRPGEHNMVLRTRPGADRANRSEVGEPGTVHPPDPIHSTRRTDAIIPPRLHSGSLVDVGGAMTDCPVLDNPLFEPDTQPLAGSLPIMTSPIDCAVGVEAKRMDEYGVAGSIGPVHSFGSYSPGRDIPGWGLPAGLLSTGAPVPLDVLGAPGESEYSLSPNSSGVLTPVSPAPSSPLTTAMYDHLPLAPPESLGPRRSARLAAQGGDIPILSATTLDIRSDPATSPSSSSHHPIPAFITHSTELDYATAMAPDNPEREQWRLAMKEELASLEAHHTWLLTPRTNQKVLDTRWIFTKKLGTNGEVVRYKARYVVKGFMQRPGLEYSDVYAPVTSKTTLRVLLAAVAARNMHIKQVDIKTAFLLGELEPELELFCSQPEGFEVKGEGGVKLICKLVKSLYGLKQAPRIWAKTVRELLVKFGFRPSRFDPALYIWQDPAGLWHYVLTYVDDFLICVHHLSLYRALLKAMEDAGWTYKELGTPEQFLSLDMQVTVDDKERCTQIILSQHSAITDLCKRFDFTTAKETYSTPMVSGDFTSDAVKSKLLPNNKLYISLIGSFIYLSTCTRPDIAFAVSTLSRFSANPTEAHWKAAKRLLIYLRDHRYLGICYKSGAGSELTVFSDSSFGECKLSRRSQTGVAILSAGSLISWSSKRQITPAVSTGEAEYQALATTAREVIWLKYLRADIGFPSSVVTIQCDSTGAISWTGDWKLEPKAKHIDVIHHYIQCLVDDGRVKVVYVNTKENKADPFTKGLAPGPFWDHVKMHGMVTYKDPISPSKA